MPEPTDLNDDLNTVENHRTRGPVILQGMWEHIDADTFEEYEHDFLAIAVVTLPDGTALYYVIWPLDHEDHDEVASAVTVTR